MKLNVLQYLDYTIYNNYWDAKAVFTTGATLTANHYLCITSTDTNYNMAAMEWDDTITYDSGEYVEYSDNFYRSLVGSNLNKNPVTETSYWRRVYLFSPVGTIKVVSGVTTYIEKISNSQPIISRIYYFITGIATIIKSAKRTYTTVSTTTNRNQESSLTYFNDIFSVWQKTSSQTTINALELEFKEPIAISQISATFTLESNDWTSIFIDVSSDGVSWQTIYQGTLQENFLQTFTFEQEALWVRFKFTGVVTQKIHISNFSITADIKIEDNIQDVLDMYKVLLSKNEISSIFKNTDMQNIIKNYLNTLISDDTFNTYITNKWL